MTTNYYRTSALLTLCYGFALLMLCLSYFAPSQANGNDRFKRVGTALFARKITTPKADAVNEWYTPPRPLNHQTETHTMEVL